MIVLFHEYTSWPSRMMCHPHENARRVPGDEVRSRELVVVAPSLVGVRDARSGPGRSSLEVFL